MTGALLKELEFESNELGIIFPPKTLEKSRRLFKFFAHLHAKDNCACGGKGRQHYDPQRTLLALVRAPQEDRLGGATLLPGLIDNHSHFMRAGETWTEEVRLDGVESRKQAIEMLDVKPNQKPEDWVQLGRVLREIAKARLPLHVHTTLTATAVHARPTILGGVFNEIHGERAYDMPPLKLVQDSGITWGFGTDTTVVDQFRPFTTLYWAVTGKMVGGTKVLRQTISREDALIAHTRKNAYFHFQENNLGSIQPGKMADMLVLDRDYLTIPADQIKDIRPAMTMVGGRIVYDAAATQTSSR